MRVAGAEGTLTLNFRVSYSSINSRVLISFPLSFVTLTGLQDQDFFMCIKFAKDDVDVDKQAELVEMLK